MKGTFEAKGVHDAAKRLSFVSAEVREPFPAAVREAGVDTIVMKHFLSGFSDADADIILKHCRAVLPPAGKILLMQVRDDACQTSTSPSRCMRSDLRPAFVSFLGCHGLSFELA